MDSKIDFAGRLVDLNIVLAGRFLKIVLAGRLVDLEIVLAGRRFFVDLKIDFAGVCWDRLDLKIGSVGDADCRNWFFGCK